MRIYFQDWIYSQNFPERSLYLFEEAILCYRATAYKGALLFSFLGFQHVIRERILNSNIPYNAIGYEKKWTEIQGKLRDEDQSDNQIIDCIRMQKPFNIFSISEDVRDQYLYWKNRRNDCAHGKENIIKETHVENFWLFIESNIVKFNVNGSSTFLIDKVKRHFNILITPKGTNPNNIISEIPSSLKLEEFRTFLEQIDVEIRKSITVFPYMDKDVKLFYLEQFNQLPKEYEDELIKYLKGNISLLLELLRAKSSLVYSFRAETELIRFLWKSKLKDDYTYYSIVVKLLQYDLIPKEQYEEFVTSISGNLSDNYFTVVGDRKQDLQILIEKGFIKILGELAFSQFPKINNFDWSRENKYLICCYLKEYNFNENVVKALHSEFLGIHYPRQLGKALRTLFVEHPELYEDYLVSANIHGVEIPEYFEANTDS